MEYQFIDPQKITDMLFDDAKYVIEFCEAGISSFEEFIEKFEEHLIGRNMEELRKAGHKIKPGAQMMGANEVVDEYEHAKQLLQDEAQNGELKKSVENMTDICSTIQDELDQLAKEQSE